MSDPKRPTGEFKMPTRLEVTDLEGRPALPPLPAGAASSLGQLGTLELEEAPIELVPYAPVEQQPMSGPASRPRREPPWALMGGIVLAAALAVAGYTFFLPHGATVTIELVDAPAGATLKLDGAPIVGKTLVLTKSAEQHHVLVTAPDRQPKTVTFTAEEDTSVELGP